jgi:hypothetical protein
MTAHSFECLLQSPFMARLTDLNLSDNFHDECTEAFAILSDNIHLCTSLRRLSVCDCFELELILVDLYDESGLEHIFNGCPTLVHVRF